MEQISSLNDSDCQTPLPSHKTKTKKINRDCPDYAPRPYSVSNLDIFLPIFSILIHGFDVITDVNVAYQHYATDEFVFFYGTIAVVLIPSFINTMVSWHM